MPSTLIQRIIDGQIETAISVANSTWARAIALPPAWSKIRLGIRLHMTDSGTTLTGGAVFAMGFCSGLSNTYGDAVTTHFVGLTMGEGISAWGRVGLVPPLNYPPSAVYRATKRIGITNTYGTPALIPGNMNEYIGSGADIDYADRRLLFLDVTKGAPNYTLFLPFVMNAYPSTDLSANAFIAMMSQPNPTPGTRYGNYGNPVDLPVDEVGDGQLSAVNFAWNRVDSTIEICDVAVAVLA